MPRYNPARGGHAPGHLRQAFLDYLDERDNHPSLDDAIEAGTEDRTLRWLIGQLWNCSDILPSGSRMTLKDWYPQDQECWTYGRTVRLLAQDLRQTPERQER
jgi:hypothetical protein